MINKDTFSLGSTVVVWTPEYDYHEYFVVDKKTYSGTDIYGLYCVKNNKVRYFYLGEMNIRRIILSEKKIKVLI